MKNSPKKDMWDVISEMLSKLSVGQAIFMIITILILLGLFFIVKSIINKYPDTVKKLLTFKKVVAKVEVKKPELIYHPLFNSIEKVRREIRHAVFEYKQKTEIFQDFMDKKLNAIRDATKTFLLREDLLTMSHEQLQHEVGVLLQEHIIQNYTNDSCQLFIANGLTFEEANGIVLLFEKWRESAVAMMSNNIEIAFGNNYYAIKKDNYAIIHEVLLAMNSGVNSIPVDGVRSFHKFNGRFAKVKYKGIEGVQRTSMSGFVKEQKELLKFEHDVTNKS